ncbi:ATP-binding protein [Streptomyces iconiensis]|uniref:Tetratricopeptide repeat protein n=1 Tax=Streptomyces iconiensis TaxID=1384038 RepID=A0ABT6ZRN7_9ACTN|nr:tetratricopeptide repeat protein [Streptomyces iconiensis]MDJ1131710.1 tetratricopeptide repeat protein [Streptomyces iconiensis]
MHFHTAPPSAHRSGPPTPRQLPGDVRGFVNRSEEIQRLDAVLTDDEAEPLLVCVCLIAGTAGAGKTSLALRWAHLTRARFPDGQLYVNLRGYDPGAPVTAQEALSHFLRALGVPATAIPADAESRAALYRSLLAERRMLVVLDNAATVAQVRPLLPGAAGCLAIVTSRSRLSGLAVRDGARRITLGTLAEEEAVALLRTITAEYRPYDDADRLTELARLCAHLPLALRIAAERAATHPYMSLDDLVRDLRDESALWDALTVGDDEEAEAVRTVFAWSYRALPEDAARLFRLLGLHPGSEFGTPAAAALAGVDTAGARRLLDVLVGTHLLAQTAPDRFEFHDLLRAYAIDQARNEEPYEGREAALLRILSWYLHTCDAARRRVKPDEPPVPLDPPPEGVEPLAFADHEEAVRWYEQERVNLLDAARTAEHIGLDGLAWRFPALLRPVHARLNPFEEWFAMGETGLRAARREGDRFGEAEVLSSLGKAAAQSQRLTEATRHHEEALTIRRELGDRLGEALALNALGLVQLRARSLQAARDTFTRALDLFQETGSPHWGPTLTTNLATVAYEAGRLPEALTLVQQALAQHRARGDERAEANALHLLSGVQREQGHTHEALLSAQHAVDIARRFGNRAWEGFWLLELGAAQLAAERADEALVSYQRSAALHRVLGDRSREARAWHGAGNTYAALHRFEEAAAFQRRAAAVHRELGDPWQTALALNGLAHALRRSGADAEAGVHAGEVVRLVAPYGDPRAGHLRAGSGGGPGMGGS